MNKGEIKSLIASGNTKDALKLLKASVEAMKGSQYNQVLLLCNQFQTLQQQIVSNTIDGQEASRMLAQINKRILLFLDASEQNRSSKTKFQQAIYGLAFLLLPTVIAIFSFSKAKPNATIKGLILIRGNPVQRAQIILPEYQKETRSNSDGTFNISLNEFKSTLLRIVAGDIDTSIQITKSFNVIHLPDRTDSESNKQEAKTKMEQNHNKIINSEKSVIQTGDNSTVNFN